MTLSSPSSRTSHVVKWGSIPAGLLLSSLLIWQASHAALSDTTTNPGNSWEVGTATPDEEPSEVTLTDDAAGTAMFNVSDLLPGDRGEECITLTYSGDPNPRLSFYGENSVSTNELDEYIRLTIYTGPSSGGTCSTRDSNRQVYSGTLADFTATRTNFSNGTTWTMNEEMTPTVFDIRYSYSADAPESVAGGTAELDFTWEAQSTGAQ